MGWFGGSQNITYESPEARDLYAETMDTMRATKDIAPEVLALRKQYSPQVIRQNLLDQQTSLFGAPAGQVTEEVRPEARYTSGADFDTEVARQHPDLAAAYNKSGHKRDGIPFKKWLQQHAAEQGTTESGQRAAQLVSEGVARYAEGQGPGQTVTRQVEAQTGLLGGPDAYRYDDQGVERGMAQRLDQYSREKTRADFASQREGDISDLETLAPRAREAYLAANPEVRDRLAQVNRMAAAGENRPTGNALMNYATGAAGPTGPQGVAGQPGLPQEPAILQTRERRAPMQAGALPAAGPQVGAASAIPSNFFNQSTGERERFIDSQNDGTNRGTPSGTINQSATAQGTQYAQSRLGRVNDLQRSLEQQAASELAAGSKLTAREQRDLQEASRSAFGARGQGGSNRALLGEMESRLAGNRQRLAERRAFAAGVSGQGEAMRKSRYQDTMGAGAQQFGQMAQAQQLGLAQQGMDQQVALNALQASRMIDPSQAILGRGLTASNAGAFQQTAGGGIAANQMNFNPMQNQYASNLNAQNYQGALAGAAGQMQAQQYNAANSADMWGTGIGAAVGLLCWVAREVYGPDNPRWLEFRKWVIFHSPVWFLKTYIKYGEQFAKFIANKPRLKGLIRTWMDTKIS